MATSKQIWRGRAVYERLLQQRDEEGLSFSELSKGSGVPIGTLQRWGRRFRDEASVKAAPFVELSAARASPVDRVEIVLTSGRRIVVTAGHPFDGLGALVRLLETC